MTYQLQNIFDDSHGKTFSNYKDLIKYGVAFNGVGELEYRTYWTKQGMGYSAVIQ